jgi:hypothetical protein
MADWLQASKALFLHYACVRQDLPQRQDGVKTELVAEQ